MHFILLFHVLRFINFIALPSLQPTVYSCDNGHARFISYAPLETIEAKSNELKGALDPVNRTFLFTLNVNSFRGFNSGLQQEHFNENYLEAAKYPKATFKGKFIENIDFTQDGGYEVRAKGILSLHGVEQERILKGTLDIGGEEIKIKSQFTILLEDHNIKIPRVVYQKIAPEITVTIEAMLKPMKE
jgi:polyisoprenoid-binding protein YceI